MALTRSDIPNLLTPGLKAAFYKAFEAAGGLQWARLAMVIPSNKNIETYPWLGATPKMREWTDERKVKSMFEYVYSLANKKYEATLAIDRTAIEDDQTGQIMIRVQELAYEASRFVEELVFTAIAAGGTSLCYDGQYYYDTDHQSGNSGTQSNKGTTALSMTTLNAARVAMRKFTDDQGKPMGIKPNLLVVPVDLEITAKELVGAIIPVHVGDGTAGSGATAATPYSNVMSTMGIEVISSEYLTDTNDWFLFDTTKPIKPIIYQERLPVEFEALDKNTETEFMRDQYLYGVRMRGAAGYGPWQLAYGAIVS